MTVMHHMKWLRSLAGWPQEVTPPWTMVVEGGALRRLARMSRTRRPQWYGLEDSTGAVHGGPARAHPSFLWYLANNTPWDRTAMEAGANAQSGEGSSAGDVFLGGDVYAFHLPIQEGDRITMVNRIAQVLEKPGRVGKLFFSDDETLFWNQHNVLVATLVRRTVAIQRQGPPAPRGPSQDLTKVPSPEPVELPPPRQLTLAEIETDKPLVLTKPRAVTIRDVVMWLSSVDDYIPYHYDTELASACGLPAPVVPGNMLACLLMTPLTDWAGEAGRLLSFQHRIKASVYPGDIVHVRVTPKAKMTDGPAPQVDVHCELVDQYGVIRSEGTARFALPLP